MPCNFHLLQTPPTLEIFDEVEEEGQLFFHPHQGKNPHMPALDQKLQLPERKEYMFTLKAADLQ